MYGQQNIKIKYKCMCKCCSLDICWHTHRHTYIYIYMFLGQNFGKAGNRVCTLGSAWHVRVNAIIWWRYLCKSASAISRDILKLASSFRNVRSGLALRVSFRWQRPVDYPSDYEALLTLNIPRGVLWGPQRVIFCDPTVTITTNLLLIFVCVPHQLKINIMQLDL